MTQMAVLIWYMVWMEWLFWSPVCFRHFTAL